MEYISSSRLVANVLDPLEINIVPLVVKYEHCELLCKQTESTGLFAQCFPVHRCLSGTGPNDLVWENLTLTSRERVMKNLRIRIIMILIGRFQRSLPYFT